MAFINISVKEHKIGPGDVEARNDPGEGKAPLFNEGRHTFEWREVGDVGAGGDMRKATYDRTDSGIVDNADTLDGRTLTQVRDHTPKGHSNEVHLNSLLTSCDNYTKEFMDALGINAATLESQSLAGVRDHVPIAHDNSYHDGTYITTCNKYTKALMDRLGIDAATLDSKTLGTGPDNIAYYDVNGRVADVTKAKGTTVDATDIGAGKLLAYDASAEALVYKTLADLVPAFSVAGKIILTGSDQIGTKTGDLAELWDKGTKLTTDDLEATEFNQPNKIPLLDASTHLTLSQVVGNVPGLSGAGKLVLTQVGTKVGDLEELWDKTTELVTTDFDDATFNVADGMVKLDASVKVPYTLVPEVGGAATFTVTASNSENKDKADYVCTGTDDQGTIMTAIAALPGGGGSIVLLDGLYTIDANDDPVKINSETNITIKGQGKGTELCLGTGISSNLIEVVDSSGITIRDLYVNGDTVAAYEVGSVPKQSGIIFITVTDSKIRNVHSSSNLKYGISLFTGSQRNTVIGCTCKSNGTSALHTDAGILVFSSTYNTIWNNICTANVVDGIVVTDDSHNNIIVGNKSSDNGGFGVWMTESDNNTITGNACDDNGSEGMQIGESYHNTFTGNSCCGCGVLGMRLTEDSSYNTLFSNTISNNDVGGLYIPWGDANVIMGNTCCGNLGFPGIRATSEYLTITGNNCSGNFDHGIYQAGYGKCVLFGNSFYGNGWHGVMFVTDSDLNTIVSNTISVNDYSGIIIQSSDYNAITANLFQDNLETGIYLYGSSNGTISGNTSIGNSQLTDNTYDEVLIWENSDYNNVQKNLCRAGSGAQQPRCGICILTSNSTENFVTNNHNQDDGFGTTALYIAAGSSTVTTAGNRVT